MMHQCSMEQRTFLIASVEKRTAHQISCSPKLSKLALPKGLCSSLGLSSLMDEWLLLVVAVFLNPSLVIFLTAMLNVTTAVVQWLNVQCWKARDKRKMVSAEMLVVVVIAQQLFSVVQVEEVCDRSRVVPPVCKLCRMALTIEQMLYGVWCHSTLRTDIWYAAGDAGLVTVQKPRVTRTQLGKSGTDWPRQRTFICLKICIYTILSCLSVYHYCFF